MMREDYRKNLNRISDLQERRLLKEILDGVLEELLVYDEAMFHKVEERVFGELEYREMNYSVVTSIAALESYDPIHEYLFPMEPEDVAGDGLDIRLQINPENGEICLGKIFLDCEYPVLKEQLERESLYFGVLVTDKGEHQIQVKLRASTEYLKKIELLYDTFQKNGIPWVTVYGPYLFKFADLVMTDCQPPLEEEENCRSYEVSFGELDQYARKNQIPLWNIDVYHTQTMNFPVPILDGVNYEHLLPIKSGSGCGYLVVVPDGFPCYMKQNKENMIITAPVDTMHNWEIMRIVPVKAEEFRSGRYPLMGNRTKNSFLNRMESNGAFIIRTQGELIRMVNSFEAAAGLELFEVHISEAAPEQAETYPMNFFLTDGIREERYKKCMRLVFKRKGEKSILDWDQMSFLVSEVQMSFPEYYCVGQLLKEEKE